VSIIILELENCRSRFESIVRSLIQAKGLQFSVIDTSKIDLIYNEIAQLLTNNILESIKNKSLSYTMLDSATASIDITSVVDRFNYHLFSEYSIDISFDSLYQMVSNIEMSVINDIVYHLPNIDNNDLEIVSHHFEPINNLVIEYNNVVTA
jgi:hypothetical protein